MKNNGIDSIIKRAFTPAQLNRYIAKYKKHIEYVRIGGRESIDDAKEKYKKLKNNDFKKLIPNFLNEDEWIDIIYNSKKKVLLEYENGKYKI